jgi:MFS family permease
MYLPAQSISRRIAAALFLAQSLFSAAVIVSFTLTAIIAADLGGSDSVAGLPSTLSLVGRAAAAYPLGWLLDRIGRRWGLSLGFLVGIAGAGLSVWSIGNGSFAGFLTGAALIGGSRAASEQSRYVAAEVFPSLFRSRVIGLIVFAGTIGAVGGPLLVAPSEVWAEQLGLHPWTGPFVLTTLFLLVAGVVVFVFLRPDPLAIARQISADELDVRRKNGEAEQVARPLSQIFSRYPVILAVAAMMIGQLVMSLLMVITPLHMDHHQHSTRAISWVIMAHTLGMFGLSPLTGWLVDRLGRVPMIAIGTGTLAISCLLAPISTELPLLAVSLFLLGLGWNFCFVAGSALLSDQLTADERGRTQGASEMAVALGAGAGTFGSGVIFAWGGMTTVSIVGLVLSLGLAVMAGWAIWQRRPLPVMAGGQD